MFKGIFICLTAFAALTGYCFPLRHGPVTHHYRPVLVHHMPHVHHVHHHAHYPHHNVFWPSLVGGIAGSVIGNMISQPKTVVVQPQQLAAVPVVVQQPVSAVQVQQVWVEGRFVDQVQPNGTVIQVWQPGHYEQQTIVR